jgi:tape measure domain-containing protein
MATQIEVTLKLIDQVSKQLGVINQTINKTTSAQTRTAANTQTLVKQNDKLAASFRQVRTAALSYIAALATSRLIDFADATQRIENRIKLALKPQQDLDDLFNKVAQSAKDSRQPLEATATAFFRIQQASKSLNISQDVALRSTELFNKLLTVQGVSMHEARSALLQYSQALQSGKFQGDEFRAISEILPSILDLISDATGKSTKQLRILARQGKITPRVMLQALGKNADKIEEQFLKTNVTMTQGFNILSTEISKTFRTLMKDQDIILLIQKTFVGLEATIKAFLQVLQFGLKLVNQATSNLAVTLGTILFLFRSLIKSGIIAFFNTLLRSVVLLTDAFVVLAAVLRKHPIMFIATVALAAGFALKDYIFKSQEAAEEIEKAGDKQKGFNVELSFFQSIAESAGDVFGSFTMTVQQGATAIGTMLAENITKGIDDIAAAFGRALVTGENFKEKFMSILRVVGIAIVETLTQIAVKMAIEKLLEAINDKEEERKDKEKDITVEIEKQNIELQKQSRLLDTLLNKRPRQQGPLTKEQHDRVTGGLGSTLFGDIGNILTPSANASDIVSGASPFNFGGGGSSVSGLGITAGAAAFGVPPAFSQPLADMFGSKIDGLGKDLLGGIVPELKNGPGKIIGKLGSVQSVLSGDLSGLGSIFSGGFSNLSGILGGLGGILGGGGIGGIFKKGKKLFGFAGGGRPPVGVASIVGEEGPELFVPDTPGTIVPNGGMGGTVVIQKLEIMPGANVDQALVDKPMTFWVDLAQEKILPALNTLGQAGNTTTLNFRGNR